jgi:hypothetical protein
MPSILNKAATKKFALDVSKQHRNGKFTRVSAAKLEEWEARLKNVIVDDVRRHPSIGKTLK